jgi:hypothetical protein
MSYWPVIDLLKGYFTLQDRDDLGKIRDKVTGKAARSGRLAGAALPALLALLEVPRTTPRGRRSSRRSGASARWTP